MPGLIQGVVNIDGQPASRHVIAVSYSPFLVAGSNPPVSQRQVVGEAVSAATGEYAINTTYVGPVVVIALDEWGEEWAAGRNYSVGDVVHPTPGRETGFVYHCTTAGLGSGTEPTWWDDTGGNTGQDGDAVLVAKPLFRPIAAGPIIPEGTSSYSDEVLADAPVAYYPLGDLTGSVALDISGSEGDGTYIGTPVLGVAGLIEGTDKAVQFNGTDSVASLPAGIFGPAFTVELWMKGAPQEGRSLYAEGSSSSNNPLFLVATGASNELPGNRDPSKLRIYVRNNSNSVRLAVQPNTVTLNGERHHVVFAYDSGEWRFDIDGVFDSSGSADLGSISFNTAAIAGLIRSSVIPGFAGVIDEVALYNYALSPSRSQAHYLTGIGSA